MLKVRLMGTEEDIAWYRERIESDENTEIIEFSRLFPIKGSKQYFRVYVEVEKREKTNYPIFR